ncbi:hypothetical protein MLD63_05200 [Paracoccus sp. TK19116]|uniref:Uncharacterized protein n=1 Tax=Paracoccus albicereus TaxID=2922394 RepID=A0ABT1MNF1_9RHOB|nr:hypothetical protein [Paracoccus albicereus]MCQ0969824.1 hypothetical protein [Paracoccus albicereus]
MIDGEIVKRDDGDDDYAVRLPISRDDFGEFLSGLISTKRQLAFNIQNPVVVDQNLILGIDRGIKERVLVQNQSSLIQATAEVICANGNKYTENSVDELLKIAPLGKVGTEGLRLEYVFAIFLKVPTRLRDSP